MRAQNFVGWLGHDCRVASATGSEIARLAIPAFLALIAEPLFLLADSAIVGHLGTASLAGLGLASAVLLTAVNLFVFLAYGTTAVVARQVGAGSRLGAIEAGIDGGWLALLLGCASGGLVALAARPLCRGLGGSGEALEQAVTYLRIAAGGIPAMLVVLACTGVFRGLQDTRTPLIAATAGFGANAALNLALVYGLHLGIAGSAIGTVFAQWGMALGLILVLRSYAAAVDASWRPHLGRVLAAALGGIPLLVRTLALRGVLLLTTWAAAGLGEVPLAAHQVTATMWTFLAFALDAIAIAGQAITGKALGAGDAAGARMATTVMIRWGLWCGVALGAGTLALHRVLPVLFTSDPGLRATIAAGLVVAGLSQPLAAFVFVVDGVLIGAGDARWLAGAMTLTLAAYLPAVLIVRAWAPHTPPTTAMLWLWVGFSWFMLARAVPLWWRVRGDAWLVTGARR